MLLPSVVPNAFMTMELKNGFLQTSNNGEIPLLGTTESLLERMGFRISDTSPVDSRVDEQDCDNPALFPTFINPLVPITASNGGIHSNLPLSDAVIRALDDIRDMRHRIEENEAIDDGRDAENKSDPSSKKTSLKDRRLNHKVNSLERQQAKLQEKKHLKEKDLNKACSEQPGEEMTEAWIKLAKTYNSLRLMLFLCSDVDGLCILGKASHETKVEFRSIPKIVCKLSDALTLLEISPRLSPVAVARTTATNESDYCGDESEKEESPNGFLPKQGTLYSWERFFSKVTTVGPQSIPTLQEIELTDDSSVESADKEKQDLSNGSQGKKLPNIPEDVRICCHSWNRHLYDLMKDVILAMNRCLEPKRESTNTLFLEQSFKVLGISETDDSLVPMKKSEELDAQFSLALGIPGGQEYRTRQKYLIAIEKLRDRIERRIKQGNSRRYNDAKLEVYGSCLSGLSLGKNADVDLSLSFSEAIASKQEFESGDLPAKKYDRFVTETVFQVKRKLERGGPFGDEFRELMAVPRARVPVIKGIYMGANNPHSEDGSLHFDICLLNDIAVSNSGLIKEYSDIDNRVKNLMIAVKRWAKDNQINAAQDHTLSSYTWMNMVIFYLQCIGFVPNLQCPLMMKECNYNRRRNPRRDNINNLDTAYLKWKGEVANIWRRDPIVDKTYSSVSMLLYGFFRFYSLEFPIHLYMVSIKRGGAVRIPKTMFSNRTSLHLCIEDPFETYDSHFPHDLGAPADEQGFLLIAQCFRDSEIHLRKILFRDEDSKDVTQLWPISQRREAPTDSSKKGRRKKRAQRNKAMTLFIESVTPMETEPILQIFEAFADRTKSSIVGSSMIEKGHAIFVDFDSEKAVHAALEAHAMKAFKWNGTTLYIEQNSKKGTKSAKARRRKVLGMQRLAIEAGNKKKENKTITNDGQNEEKDGIIATIESPDFINDDEAESGKHQRKNSDSTLVLQNFGRMKEKDVVQVFRPFADQTDSKILGCVVSNKSKVAYIDFDRTDAVHAALAEHARTPLEWNGILLEILPKSHHVKSPKAKAKNQKIQKKKNFKSKQNSMKEKTAESGKGKSKKNKGQKDGRKSIVDTRSSIEGQL